MAKRRESTTYELLSEYMFGKPAAGVAGILGHVAFDCQDYGLPPLTVIVVNKETTCDGAILGVFALARKPRAIGGWKVHADRRATVVARASASYPSTPEEHRQQRP